MNRPLHCLSIRCFQGLALLGVAALCAALPAQPRIGKSSLTATTVETAVDPMQEVTPERTAAAEMFARINHPELADLLTRLKGVNHGQYDNAIRDLFRESERLAKLKGRDPDRYALELESWKVASRIQLAIARLAMEDSPELRSELRSLVEAKQAARLALLRLDRERLSNRLSKLDAELAELQSDPAASAQQDLDKLIKTAQARIARQKTSVRPKDSKTPKTTGAPGSEPAPASSRGGGASAEANQN